jgi:hypothetical protein
MLCNDDGIGDSLKKTHLLFKLLKYDEIKRNFTNEGVWLKKEE